MKATDSRGIKLLDIEIMRTHYAETLLCWRESFMKQGCEYFFRAQHGMVMQMLVSHDHGAVPISRSYMGEREKQFRTTLCKHSLSGKKKASANEWERLCDGCGKCCVLKLEDTDTGRVHYTDVACKLLDCKAASCTNYANRKKFVPDCIVLTPQTLSELPWMPDTCAYRLLHEGQDLPHWHPLISGDPDSVRQAGHSVAGRVSTETSVRNRDLIDHITQW